MKKFRLGIIALTAVGALAAGPAVANAATHADPSPTVYDSVAADADTVAAQVEPRAIRGVINAGRAMYAGFKAGTSPREVGRMLGWGSFLASAPVEDAKSFNQDQAFDR